MRIGIYIKNDGIRNVDCSEVFYGNPGIGGTEYSILLLAESLKRYYPNDETILYCTYVSKLPRVDIISKVESLLDLVDKVKDDRCDVLILAYSSFEGQDKNTFLNAAKKENISIISWSHNFLFKKDCDDLANCPAVKANIFVGKQQLDKYIDHQIYLKSKHIFNMYPVNEQVNVDRNNYNTVTYIGSLVKSKGFHILAKHWKKILKVCPDAQLNVIGSGKLYNRNEKLGKYKIAEAKYEESFINYLLDENGELLKSVHFLGILGKEKNEIIDKTAVGVVNPTGRTETFGISALDFESRGIPVVTIAKGGFLDTVINNDTGLLFRNKYFLSRKVIRLLKDEPLRKRCGKKAFLFSQKFSTEKISSEWYAVISDVVNKQPIICEGPTEHYFSDLKIFRIINRKIKDCFHIKKGFSVISIESSIYDCIRRIR